ncbi:hypothetical protein NUW58_g3698 [Xylaria curta]|uniref:Uncharacterized protein n=1 Tax=Xylaria curta TaxID=42375 RepID=A0ACC1PBE5_9PEZI|nr:hypothetical protein NUW58_g3698 [Xylaria curta]
MEDGFSFQGALQHLCMRGLDVINRGFSGYNTKNALELLPQIFLPPSPTNPRIEYLVCYGAGRATCPALSSVHPLVLLGANDACLPVPTSTQGVPIAQYKENLIKRSSRRMLPDTDPALVITHEHIKAHNPKILLVTPPPLDEIRSFAIDLEKGHKERVRTAAISAQYSETVRQVAAEQGVMLIDLQKAVMEKAISMTPDYDPSGPPLGYPEGKRGALERLLPDGLHMSGEAYKVLFDIVKPHIKLPNDYYVFPEWRILIANIITPHHIISIPAPQFATPAGSENSNLHYRIKSARLETRTRPYEREAISPDYIVEPRAILSRLQITKPKFTHVDAHVYVRGYHIRPETQEISKYTCCPLPATCFSSSPEFHDFVATRICPPSCNAPRCPASSRTYSPAPISLYRCRQLGVGMDPRFPATRDELYNVQMDVKQVQIVQNSHAERLSRLEKRQADDAAIKSVWNSPFPSALSGTPQHGPIQMPSSEIFDDFDEQSQNLLGSLQLDAEDEPTRRGAASRANSVRFDESALQSSSWAHNGRQSGDFGPIRPGSGLGTHGLMERSMSHKSDGRHSSAGHSVHSVHSHHSVASGRGSSLGLDTTFTPGGQEEESPVGIPEPPPSFFILGSVPSIVRCWLTPNFSHDTLLYADICTGSQKSIIEFSLIKDLGLTDDVHRDLDGVHRIRLHVYLTEATVSHSNSRGASPAPQMPSLGCTFEVAGVDQPDIADAKKAIRIFIGSEALREHSADVLFSQNRMTLYSSDREKLSVPFVRPEDHGAFKNIRTMAVFAEKPKLNATARPFVLGDSKTPPTVNTASESVQIKTAQDETDSHEVNTPVSEQASQQPGTADASTISESGGESERFSKENSVTEQSGIKDSDTQPPLSDGTRRASGASGIWNSWRQGTATNGDQKESALLSGYQPAGRGRNMKILKPMKSTSSSSARTGAA